MASPASGIIADGQQITTFTLTLQDAAGNPLVGRTVKLATSEGSLTQPAAPTDSNGQTTATLSSLVAGTKTVSFSVPSELASLQASPIFIAGLADPTQSTLALSVNSGLTADGVASVTLTGTLKDANQNPIVGQPVTFAATGTSNTLTQPAAVSDANGQVTATLQSTKAELKTISFATPAELVDPALIQTQVFLPGAPAASTSTLVATPSSGVVADGSASAVLTATLKDAFGNPVSGQSVLFSTGAGTVTQPTAVTDLSGQTSGAIASTSSGTKTISLASPSQISSVQAQVTFASGVVDPAHSTLTLSSSNSITADGTTTLTLTATLRDTLNNPVSGQAVTFAVSGSGNTLNQPTLVTDAAGQATGTLKSTVAETKSITIASPAGLTGATVTRSSTFVPGPASATTSTLAATPSTGINADGTTAATLTITLKDAQGNPVPAQTVVLASSGGTLTQPASSTNASGVTTASLVSAVSGTKTVSIASPLQLAGVQTTVGFSSGAVDAAQSTLTLSPSTPVTADGSSPVTLTATLKDSNGNPVAGQTVTFSVSGTANTLNQPSVTTDANGQATGTFTSTKAESKTVSFSAPSALGSITQSATFVAGAPVAGTSLLSASPASGVLADGSSTSTVTLTLKDAYSNPVTSQAVALSLIGGSGNVLSTPAATNASGTTSMTLASTTSGAKTLTVTSPSGLSALQTTVSFVSGAADPNQSTLSLSSSSPVTADGASTVTLTATLKDSQGNPIAGQSVTFSASGTGNTLSQPAPPTDALGQTSVTLKSTVAESKTVGITSPASLAVPALNQTVTFVPGAPALATSTLTASPSSGIIADGTASATLTITLKDAKGNPVPSQSVVLSSSGGSLTQPSTLTNASGQTTATLRSSTAGSIAVNLSSPSALGSLQTSVGFVSGSVDPATSTLTLSTSSSITADGVSAVTLTATLKDSNSNPVSGQSVTFSASGTGNTLSQPAPPTDASGQTSVTLKSTVAETKTVGITSPAALATPGLTKSVTFIPGAPSALTSTLTASPSSGLTADGSSAATLTLTVKDAQGNVIPSQSVVLATSGGTLTQPASPTDGTGRATATLKSTSSGAKTVSVTTPSALATLQTTVTFNAGFIDPSKSTLTLSTSNGVVADDTASVTLTATLRDSNNNPVQGQSVTFASTGTSNTLTQPSSSTDSNGQASGSLKSTKAESKSVSIASPLGLSSVTNTVLFIAGPAVSGNSTLTATPTSGIIADGVATSTVTALLRDQYNNPVSGQLIGVSVSGGTGNVATSPTTTNASGSTSFDVSSTSSGTKTIALTSPSGVNGLSTSVTFSPPLACVSGPATVLLSPATSPVVTTTQHLFISGTCAVDSVLTLSGDVSSADVVVPSGNLSQSCALNGTFSFELAKIVDGTFNLQFQSSCGTTQAGTQTIVWTRDTVAPAAPVITSPSLEPYSSHVLNLALGGTCVTGNTVELSGISSAQSVCNSQGKFQFNLSATADGSYSLMVRQKDGAGNSSPWATRTWIVDTISPPTPTLVTPGTTPYTSADTNFTLTGTCETGATVGMSGDSLNSLTCPANGRFSFSFSKNVDGPYQFLVSQVDAAGNSSDTLTFDWVRDTTIPNTPVLTSPSTTPHYTKAVPLTVTGSCGAGNTVLLNGDVLDTEVTSPVGVPSTTCGAGNTFSFTVQKAVDGQFSLNFSQMDSAGNTSAPVQMTWVRDSVAPAAPVLTTPASSPYVAPGDIGLVGNCEASATVLVSSSLGNQQTPCASNGTFSLAIPVSVDGTYSLTLKQQDQAGNQSTTTSQSWVRNSTSPAPPTITSPSVASTTNNSSTMTITGGCTADRTVALSGVPASAVTSPVAGVLTQTCPSNGTFTYQISRTTEGTDTLSFTQSYGGYTSSAVTRTWIRDFTAPNTTITSAPASRIFTNSASFSFSSSETGGTFQCQFDGGSYTTCTSPYTPPTFTNGSHTFNVVAVDVAGNTDPTPGSSTFISESYNSIALYHFTSGAPLTDSSLYTSPENSPLTNTGGATSTPGKFGDSWRFVSTSGTDLLQAPDNQSQDLTVSTMTIEMWAKASSNLASNNQFYVLASKMGASGNMGWELRLLRVGGTKYSLVFLGSQNGTTTTSVTSTTCVSSLTGAWNHYAVTWNKGTVTFYCNGTTKGTGTIGTPGSAKLFLSSAPLMIGQTATASGSKMPYKGDLDEFRLSQIVRWSAAFTPPTSQYSAD